MGEGDAKLLMMVGAFLGWQAVLFALLAGSIQGLIVAGIAMATGSPMIPKRPDEPAEPAPPAGSVAPEAPVAAPEGPDDPGPAKMVFGPMLALAALEYLFLGDPLLGWLAELLSS